MQDLGAIAVVKGSLLSWVCVELRIKDEVLGAKANMSLAHFLFFFRPFIFVV